jgi:demethylmenaquinone methyltransferase/2-methoxy-6-polyprenyl-1,4-benzoquinol methylase
MTEPCTKPLQEKEPSRQEIWKMFDSISSTYDKTNRWMTLGLDLYWRKAVSALLPKKEKLILLDCATGTGDQLLSLLKHSNQIEQAIGIDLSEEMLEIARKKIRDSSYQNRVTLTHASALDLPFPKDSFDCITLSFGIRNVTDIHLCFQEMLRVLKPGGRVLILETSLPQNKLLKALNLFYIRNILPRIGGWISKKKEAYSYLNKTTETFPHGKVFCNLLEKAGFNGVKAIPMTLGSVSIYVGEKPE